MRVDSDPSCWGWRVDKRHLRSRGVFSSPTAAVITSTETPARLAGRTLEPAQRELSTLASQNHLFDTSTPTGSNYQTGGKPAPPRDARSDLSDLLDLFSF